MGHIPDFLVQETVENSTQPLGSPIVKFVGGLRQFASDNELKEGDLLVFVLNVDARSEFRVHIIRSSTRKGPKS